MRHALQSALCALLIVVSAIGPAHAQQISIIRDAEIERDIKIYATPIWHAAGLDPNVVRVHLVNNDSINAFVAAGQRIFVFTGMLKVAEDPLQVIGVLAHETGHITGGHLARFQDGLKGASTISILSLVLGAAAMAAGAPAAGAAILGSGGEFATRSFLIYSRTQESAADQAGLSFLTASEQSGSGLISFFEYLGDQEALMTENKDPYVRSHPMTSERIERLRADAEKSPYWNTPARPEDIERLNRIKAKLIGFLEHPTIVFQTYPLGDTSPYARYARTIAYHRQALETQAMAELDALLADAPHDPYYLELKAQILFESGKIEESIEPYRAAVAAAPYEPLIRVSLAQSLLAKEDKALADEAIEHLVAANRLENDNGFAWHQLALAYTIKDDVAMAALSAAERYTVSGEAPRAARQAKIAVDKLKPQSPEWFRAQDLYMIARAAVEDSYRRRGKEPPTNDDPEVSPGSLNEKTGG
ncbi:M48 family metalloprotease [Emcibacter sp. SYSU 3D8]|uniref:M48 family metalloprotease n=1 Tax=Emcibacter sp. SYSU 3D8 TaxID=3133969 RepID=UPI0031FE53CE